MALKAQNLEKGLVLLLLENQNPAGKRVLLV